MFREFFWLCVVAISANAAFNKTKIRSFLATSADCEQNLDVWRYPHADSCYHFWECDENNEIQLEECPIEEAFDPVTSECVDENEIGCWTDEVDPDPEWPEDSECPRNTNDVVFLPGAYCDEYYICINGEPRRMECRQGQHWNEENQYCDDPHSAGCDETAVQESLPECNSGVVGSFPHPQNCNWFVHCDNGNRSIQQCQHLFHFDIEQNRCIILIAAKCIKD